MWSALICPALAGAAKSHAATTTTFEEVMEQRSKNKLTPPSPALTVMLSNQGKERSLGDAQNDQCADYRLFAWVKQIISGLGHALSGSSSDLIHVYCSPFELSLMGKLSNPKQVRVRLHTFT